MDIQTISGKVTHYGFLEDENGIQRDFKPLNVDSGNPEIGDDLFFQLDKSNKIKKIWLLKELGKSDSCNSLQNPSNVQTNRSTQFGINAEISLNAFDKLIDKYNKRGFLFDEELFADNDEDVMIGKKDQVKNNPLMTSKDQCQIDDAIEETEVEIMNIQSEGCLQGSSQREVISQSSSEYKVAEELFLKDHRSKGMAGQWNPQIKKIEKITNKYLKLKWLEAKLKLFKPQEKVKLMFYNPSSNDSYIQRLTSDGFRVPTNPGKYGYGNYLGSHASKLRIDPCVTNMILLCEVLVGKSMPHIISIVDCKILLKTMTLEAMKELQFDSICIKYNMHNPFEEYVVYNPQQIYPKYLIYFSCDGNSGSQIPKDTLTFQNDFTTGKKVIRSSRETDLNNPLEPHFALVEARFLRMMQRKGQLKFKITYIEFYKNPHLEGRFNKKHEEFKIKYGNSRESKILLAFHGTRSTQAVDNIMNSNFIPSLSGKFGAGVYFSELPDYTFGYGGHLIMAMLLPGKTSTKGGWARNGGCQPGFDSHGMIPFEDSFSEIVIFNIDQILPCYVIHYQ